MDFSGSAWTEGLGETKLLIGWTSVERLKLDNRGRSSFGMIAALKATGCAKVVNTQTESQMGKSHKHTHTLNVSNSLMRCPHSVREVASFYARTSTGFCNNYSALLCLRRGFEEQINSERFIQTEQNAAPELSGGEVSCWRRHPLANHGNNEKNVRAQTNKLNRMITPTKQRF